MDEKELYEKLGIANADEATKQEVLANVISTVENRFAGIVDDMLSDEQASELEGVVERDDQVEVSRWIKQNVPSAEELYTKVLEDHVAELQEKLDS